MRLAARTLPGSVAGFALWSGMAMADNPQTVGYIVNYATHEWYQNVIKGMQDRADQLGTVVVATHTGLGDRLDAGFACGMDAADAASCMGGLEATRWFARDVGSGHRVLRVCVSA